MKNPSARSGWDNIDEKMRRAKQTLDDSKELMDANGVTDEAMQAAKEPMPTDPGEEPMKWQPVIPYWKARLRDALGLSKRQKVLQQAMEE